LDSPETHSGGNGGQKEENVPENSPPLGAHKKGEKTRILNDGAEAQINWDLAREKPHQRVTHSAMGEAGKIRESRNNNETVAASTDENDEHPRHQKSGGSDVRS